MMLVQLSSAHEHRRALREKINRLWSHLDERARRLFAASEARQLGRGGVSVVSRACGLSCVTITEDLHELDEGKRPELPCHRWSGGGRMLSGDCCLGIVARGTPPPGSADYC